MSKRIKPQCKQSRVVAQSKLFTIEQRHLCFSNGQERIFERLQGKANGAVLIVPVLDNDTVLLIREYAAGIDEYDLSLPKGLKEAGEDALTAANREMMEEIGYGAHKLEFLKAVSVAPGYFGLHTEIVMASELYEKRLEGDEPEEIEVVPWKLSRLDDLIQREDFSEARSLAALYMVRDKLQGL